MNNKDKKNVMIVALLIAVVFMSVGYALLSAQLDVREITTMVKPIWNVEITAINSIETEGFGENISAKIENRFSAKFNTHIQAPGDKVTYVINVKNKGTIDAKLNSIMLTPTVADDSFIIYEIEGLEAGETLPAGESKAFALIASYNQELEDTTQEDLSREITLMLDYKQN